MRRLRGSRHLCVGFLAFPSFRLEAFQPPFGLGFVKIARTLIPEARRQCRERAGGAALGSDLRSGFVSLWPRGLSPPARGGGVPGASVGKPRELTPSAATYGCEISGIASCSPFKRGSLAGEITITRDGQARTYHAGDYWLTPAQAVHAEQAGPETRSAIRPGPCPSGGMSSLPCCE